MKAAITILLFYHAMQVVSSARAESFDLYHSMDEARSAIMSFYDPTHEEAEAKSEHRWFEEDEATSEEDEATSEEDKATSISIIPDIRIPMLGKKSRGRPGIKKMSIKRMRIRPRYKPVLRLKPLRTVRPFPRPQPTRAINKSKPVTTRRVSLNKFAEAIEDIEKALADAQIVGRVKHDEQRLRKLRDLIKTAVQKRSYRFARKAIGQAMFTIRKINEQRKAGGRGKRKTVLSSEDFLDSVRQTIGVSAFNDLLAMQGQVTLMFAIDDTGSMRQEIAAAKKIATSIVDEERAEPVDYILSPFNDPGTGPVTYCEKTERNRFVKAIDSLSPHSGGDCPELTFKGMIDAIDEGPYPNSALYVFTDAGPKDATEDNILHLKQIAEEQGVVINFFVVQNSGCARTADISSFREIAQATMGQVFELKDHNELEQLQGLTATSLGGTAVVVNAIHNQSARKKRSLSEAPVHEYDHPIDTLVIADRPLTETPKRFYSIPVDDSTETPKWLYSIPVDDSIDTRVIADHPLSKTPKRSYSIPVDDSIDTLVIADQPLSKTPNSYSIPVDDSIDTLLISVTADQPTTGGSMWSVSLTSPTGNIAGVTTNNLDQGTVYQIPNPNVGVWNLGITADSSVNYDLFVKGSSADNIDFEYYFVRTTVRRGVSTTFPITSPLLGGEAEAILTLGGIAHVDRRTLSAELVTLEGDVIVTSQPVSLTSKDRKGIRHSFKFYPPNQIFKIKLKGRTKKGNPFERICHAPIKPETLLVKVLFARNDYTIKQGSTGYVIFMIENFGNDDVVDINSFGSMGTVQRQSRSMSRVRKGRKTSFTVTFRGNSKATKGRTVTIVVSVKGRNSGSKSVMSVPLLVV